MVLTFEGSFKSKFSLPANSNENQANQQQPETENPQQINDLTDFCDCKSKLDEVIDKNWGKKRDFLDRLVNLSKPSFGLNYFSQFSESTTPTTYLTDSDNSRNSVGEMSTFARKKDAQQLSDKKLVHPKMMSNNCYSFSTEASEADDESKYYHFCDEINRDNSKTTNKTCTIS